MVRAWSMCSSATRVRMQSGFSRSWSCCRQAKGRCGGAEHHEAGSFEQELERAWRRLLRDDCADQTCGQFRLVRAEATWRGTRPS